MKPRRSVLFMPGSNARALEKARNLPADGIILDLEDSVAPDAKLLARNVAGVARKSREKQHDGIAQFNATTGRQNHRCDRKSIIGEEVDPIKAPIGGPQLILATHILPENLLLDANRCASKFALCDHPALKSVKRVDQPHRE